MADILKENFKITSELESGDKGEFTLWLNDTKLAEKGPDGFPDETEILESVKAFLSSQPA